MAARNIRQKVHPKAKLKTLPEETREEIFAYSNDKTIVEVCEYILKKHGIKVSTCVVSQFLQYQRLQRQSEKLDRDQDTLKAILKGHKPKLSAIELDRYAESLFKIKAIQEMDAATYVDVTSHRRKLDLEEIKVQQRDRELALAEKRLALQIRQAEEAKELVSKPLSDEEKMRGFREIFGITSPPSEGP